jgi:ankyrin repeat protein
MDYLKKLITDIELHSVAGITECFKNGISPNAIHNGKPLIYELINEYPRGPKFKECFKAFVDHGLEFEDKVLLAVFLNDAVALERELGQNPEAVRNRYSFDCAFTPLFEATLLHVCAEYNHVACAKVLVDRGADINAKAGVDEFGFGGQTPIFHTVNQNENRCIEALDFLLSRGADVRVTVKGLIWGKGYSWETFIPAVNPVSYAMMGLLRQFQRSEADIYAVVGKLMKAGYGVEYVPVNIPNRYLNE